MGVFSPRRKAQCAYGVARTRWHGAAQSVRRHDAATPRAHHRRMARRCAAALSVDDRAGGLRHTLAGAATVVKACAGAHASGQTKISCYERKITSQ